MIGKGDPLRFLMEFVVAGWILVVGLCFLALVALYGLVSVRDSFRKARNR